MRIPVIRHALILAEHVTGVSRKAATCSLVSKGWSTVSVSTTVTLATRFLRAIPVMRLRAVRATMSVLPVPVWADACGICLRLRYALRVTMRQTAVRVMSWETAILAEKLMPVDRPDFRFEI